MNSSPADSHIRVNARKIGDRARGAVQTGYGGLNKLAGETMQPAATDYCATGRRTSSLPQHVLAGRMVRASSEAAHYRRQTGAGSRGELVKKREEGVAAVMSGDYAVVERHHLAV